MRRACAVACAEMPEEHRMQDYGLREGTVESENVFQVMKLICVAIQVQK